MSFTTRPAVHDDLPVLYQFEQGVIAFERTYDPTLKEKETTYYDIPELIEADHIELLVVETDQKIIGCGYARLETAKHYLQHKQHAYFGFMYVLPDYRGQGVNKLIMDGLFAWAKGKGVYELRLEVYDGNAGAIRAYEKVGFVKHLIEMRLGGK